MLPQSKLTKALSIITKIFLIGLLIQFFLQTFVTYRLGLEGKLRTVLWMRKEIVLVILLGLTIFLIRQQRLWKHLREKLPIKWFVLLFFALIGGIGLISFFVTHVGLNAYILSIRYSMIGFFIFILFFVLQFVLQESYEDINTIKRYTKVIKKIVIAGLIRRGVIRLMPNLLNHFGYNQYNVEGAIGIAPPAVYYTQYNEGYVRNQFLFERPISFGFFLIAFFPLFFMFVLKNRGRKNMLWRGGLFGLVVFSTFSRAARIARFAEIAILLFIQFNRKNLKLLLYGLGIFIIIGAGLGYLGRNKILTRNYSDIGHFQMLVTAVEKIKEKPLRGQGAGTAGPASYQLSKEGEGYNPENQFLQIRLEYGAFCFIAWMILYLYLIKIGYTAYKDTTDPLQSKQQRLYGYIIVAFSLGLLGLSIEGMVLHSFVDRMIVYPFMALFGLAYAVYWKHRNIGK